MSGTAPTQPVATPVRTIPGSDFDNVLLKDVKLKQLPKFLWQNSGYNGLFRMFIWVERNFSSAYHFNYRWRWPLLIVGFFMMPGLYSKYQFNLRTRDAYIFKQYGEDFEKLPEAEKQRIRLRVTNMLNENR